MRSIGRRLVEALLTWSCRRVVNCERIHLGENDAESALGGYIAISWHV